MDNKEFINKYQLTDAQERQEIHGLIIKLRNSGKTKEEILNVLIENFANSKFADSFEDFVDNHLKSKKRVTDGKEVWIINN